MIPTDAHGFQLETIGHLLDEDGVLLVVETGTVKTDMFHDRLSSDLEVLDLAWEITSMRSHEL